MMFKFCKSDFLNFEFLRLIGVAPCGGSEIAECLEGISEIRNDVNKWYPVWQEKGLSAEQLADAAQQEEDQETAKRAYLRASNYYRSSEFFLDPSDQNRLRAINDSIRVFEKAIALFPGTSQSLQIPYGDNLLPAYLLQPVVQTEAKAIPLILTVGGGDSTQEELYYYLAAGALQRGYAILSFDGPGQGIVLRRDNIPFRPDFEVVTSAVLDYIHGPNQAKTFHNIDLNKIVVFGASMGGYFALRAATDQRVAACISCDGFYDMADTVRTRIPSLLLDTWLHGRISDYVIDQLMNIATIFNQQMRWEVSVFMWNLGMPSPSAGLREMMRYTLEPKGRPNVLSTVRCPVLVTGPSDTMYFPARLNAERIYKALSVEGSKENRLWVPDSIAQGGLQAKVAAISRMNFEVFRWLRGVLE